MYSKLFVDAGHLLALPVFALVLFVAIFVMIVVQVMRKPATEIAALASIPLEEERGHE